MFHRGNVPVDFQKIARLLGRPESVGDHGHAATFHERQFENVSYSRQLASFLVVDRLNATTEDRWMRDHCDLHPGQIQIQTELLRAVTLSSAVQTRHSRAD